MAVGAGLIIGLAKVCHGVEHDVVVDRAAGGAMVMAGEEGRVAGDAFAAASDSRAFELAVGGRIVAGGASIVGMNLTAADERCGGGGVAAHTVRHGGGGGGGRVHLDLVGVIVVVGIEVSGMAGGAGAAIAKVRRGIAVAVNAGDQ